MALDLGYEAWLVLDAFYAVGTLFKAALEAGNIPVVTRAKANCRAHIPAKALDPEKGRGRPRKYVGSVKVQDLHKREAASFENKQAKVYGRTETVAVHSTTLIWKPAGTLLFFVLAKTSSWSCIAPAR